MKRLLITALFTLALLVGATGSAPLVHASAGAQAGAVSDAQSAANKNATDPGSPGAGFATIMQWIMKLFAWLLGIAALALDYSVYYTVINMGAYVNNMAAIGVTWRTLTSIGNIMLIFGFLAIGISTILNTERMGYGKKMLPMLLLAAIFINFSLFFSEAVIDIGNIFATQFFTQINGGVQPSLQTLQNMPFGSEGISNKIMAQVGLQTMYNAGQVNTKIFNNDNAWIIGFMGIILFIVAAFVFFALAFILIARFIFLVFLIILAPIGFAGLAIPQLAGLAKKWWDALFQQTITAPVLLLLLYIAIAVIADAQFLTGFCPQAAGAVKCDLLGFTSNNFQGLIGMILSFLIAMGLLVGVIIAAGKLSAFGAGAVSKVSNAAIGKMKSIAMAPARYAGNTAKRTGKWAFHSTAGRGLNYLSKKIKTSSSGQTQTGRLLATALGAGGKGYVEARDKSVKTHQEYMKSVDKAFEEKHMEAITNAEVDRALAQKAANDAKLNHERDNEVLITEVKRLEKLVADNKKNNVTGPKAANAESALMMAKNQLENTQGFVALMDAEKVLEKRKEDEKKAKDVLHEDQKAAKIGYAKKLQEGNNPFNRSSIQYFGGGKGADMAALKILQDAVKVMSEEEKALEAIKKAVTPLAAPSAGNAPAAPAH
jgi:hypothetical protein